MTNKMFEDEVVRVFSGLRIAWYPKEKICLVLSEKSTRVYNKIPKKYSIIFEDNRK